MPPSCDLDRTGGQEHDQGEVRLSGTRELVEDAGVRLFVALTPPDVVAEELAARVVPLRKLAPELRWSRPEQWHLTLAFLGEVRDAARNDMVSRLERAARRHPPLPLSFAGGGRFGSRVLWAGVRGDRKALRRLAESVRAAARRAHLPVEERPYRPHLTLARAADVELRPLVKRLASFEGQEWVAEELHLVRSHLGAGPGGTALYEPLASWPLGATAAGSHDTRAASLDKAGQGQHGSSDAARGRPPSALPAPADVPPPAASRTRGGT